MKKEIKIDESVVKSVKNVMTAAAQTLCQVLKSFNGTLHEVEDGQMKDTGRKLWDQPTSCGASVKEVLGLMGIEIDARKGLTYPALDKVWTIKVGAEWAVYMNRTIKTRDKEVVYVRTERGEKVGMKKLTVWTPRAIARDGWTAALVCKGIEQNYLPKHQAKKAAKQLEAAKNAPVYYVLRDKEFVAVPKEDVVF